MDKGRSKLTKSDELIEGSGGQKMTRRIEGVGGWGEIRSACPSSRRPPGDTRCAICAMCAMYLKEYMLETEIILKGTCKVKVCTQNVTAEQKN